MKNGRTRHTASFLLSHFLNSNDSLSFTGITASLVAVLRYMYDVMEMNYAQTGLTICDLSISRIATFARTSRASTTRLIAKAIKLELLAVTLKRNRAPTHYGIGNLISTRLPVSLEPVDNSESRLTMSLALGSQGAYQMPNKAHSEPLIRKAFKKEGKKERGGAPLASPLSVFFPDEKNTLFAQDHQLDLVAELESFRSRHKGPKNQYEFGRWLQKGHEYQQRIIERDKKASEKQEIWSTVPEYGPGHPRWEMLHGCSTEH